MSSHAIRRAGPPAAACRPMLGALTARLPRPPSTASLSEAGLACFGVYPVAPVRFCTTSESPSSLRRITLFYRPALRPDIRETPASTLSLQEGLLTDRPVSCPCPLASSFLGSGVYSVCCWVSCGRAAGSACPLVEWEFVLSTSISTGRSERW